MSKFSVIVPIYYGESYISGIINQIESCKRYLGEEEHIEVLFVNDAPDAPLGFGWKSKIIDIKIINTERNAGIHKARLKGLAQCIGEYVLFLDQDDKIEPEYLKSQMQNIGDNDAVICEGLIEGQLYPKANNFEKILLKKYVLTGWNPIISPGQVLLRKKAIPAIWIENIIHYNGADDWFLWLCMLANGWKVSLNKNILYKHVTQNSNASDDDVSMLQSEQEVLKIVQEKGILTVLEQKWLMEGFFLKNLSRTRYLFGLKKKMQVLNRWIRLKEKNIRYLNYLNLLGIQSIAIYGCGMLGENLYLELKDSIKIEYFIDKNAKKLQHIIPIYTLQDILPKVDGIIITLIAGMEEVKREIENKMDSKIFILMDWIMGMEVY